jgi:hypothetical protein
MAKVIVTGSGPLFDGRAERDMQSASDEWVQNLAILGASIVRQTENASFRTQTPHARMLVEAKQDPPGWKIWDQNLIYGPWLEGTGSRNRTTRFKGYASFRRSVQVINARAKEIGQPIVARWAGRMNA